MKQILESGGIAILAVITLVFAWCFFTAYSFPSKTTTLYIDLFGEANIEFVMFVILIPVSMYFILKFFISAWETGQTIAAKNIAR